MTDPIKPDHYKDLIKKWYEIAPSYEAFAFALYTHIDKYSYRFNKKNGLEDLDKLVEYTKHQYKYYEMERLKHEQEEEVKEAVNGTDCKLNLQRNRKDEDGCDRYSLG